MGEAARQAVDEIDATRARLDAELDALEQRLPDRDVLVRRTAPAIVAALLVILVSSWLKGRWAARRQDARLKQLVSEAITETASRVPLSVPLTTTSSPGPDRLAAAAPTDRSIATRETAQVGQTEARS